VGLTTLPCKKKTVEKPPRNSAGFSGGGQCLSWAVEPRKEEEEIKLGRYISFVFLWKRMIQIHVLTEHPLLNGRL
jgi:hypothetical protein